MHQHQQVAVPGLGQLPRSSRRESAAAYQRLLADAGFGVDLRQEERKGFPPGFVVGSEPPAMPCGACRQVLAEFGFDLAGESVGPSTQVTWTLRHLLPDAFGPGNLA